MLKSSEDFKNYLIIDKCIAEAQVKDYMRIIEKFKREYPDTDENNLYENVRKFYLQYRSDKYAPKTARNIAVILNHYLSFHNIENHLPLPKSNHPLTEYLTQEEFNKVMIHFKSYRDLAMFLLMAKGGLRVSEVVNLNIDDFKYVQKSYENGSTSLRLSPTLSRYPVEMLLHLLNNWDDFDDFKNIGFYYWSGSVILRDTKNRRDYERELSADVVLAIVLYTALERSSHPHYKALFQSKRNRNRLTRNRICEIMSKAGKSAGVKVYPHKLRHTCATHLALNDVDPYTIQEHLGHNSLITTMKYIHIANQKKNKKYLQNFLNLND